jgi:hypothetical protein
VHKVYVNGVEQSLDGAEAVDITQSSNAVSQGTIFMSNGTPYGIYEGALDEIMFFNRELSAAETMSIYHLADQ